MIAGDFCLQDDGEAFPCGYPACCGQGTVNRSVLEELCNKTQDIRHKFREDGIVWLSHFPPSGDLIRFSPALNLNGWQDLISAAKAYNIKYILSGHIHENRDFEEQGIQILGVGSACSFMETSGNWLRSVTFDVQDGDVHLNNLRSFKWDNKKKGFREV